MQGSTLNQIIQKWSGPTGVVVLFGAIIWGVQLNLATLSLVEEVTIMRQQHEELKDEVNGLSSQVLRMTAVLDSAIRTQDALERRMTRNESWISENRDHEHRN